MIDTFYYLRGTLSVDARGYWYTRGGEKGSFGYYPHLKSPGGLPVYPDTQLHGDLRLAARWALDLGGGDHRLLERLFGRGGDARGALLHLGDLTLAPEEHARWRNERFQIKTRIEIDDQSRTVANRMLVQFEVAWLDGLRLLAPLYAGWFTSREEAEAALELLREATALLPGFGALRSRGYGRGRVVLDQLEIHTIHLNPDNALPAGHCRLFLEGLVNIRNKPVAVDHLQWVGSRCSLSAEQLRGWFVRCFRAVTGRWPEMDEMAQLRFSELYPTPSDETLAYPPPLTVLRDEDGHVEDYWGQEDKTQDDDVIFQRNGNRSPVKLKPLDQGCFVTSDGKLYALPISFRFRNAMDDDFRTRENGLFAQQYLPAGTLFGGEIRFNDPDSAFCRLAGEILTKLPPAINGALFRPQLKSAPEAVAASSGPRLVVRAQAFDPARDMGHRQRVLLGTERGYNTTLGRPRRPKPVLLPGSVVHDDRGDATLAWAQFGHALQVPPAPPEPPRHAGEPSVVPLPDIAWQQISRAQAGRLRTLLDPGYEERALQQILWQMAEKHREKDPNSALAELYDHLCQALEKDGVDAFRATARAVIDHLKSEIWWPQKQAEKGKEAGS